MPPAATPRLPPRPVAVLRARRALCRASYEDFVRHFWDTVPGAGTLRWNWHMTVLCQEIQNVAERVFAWEPAVYDLIINISPGTSKTTICSILAQPWVWARMPEARFINATHTQDLVLSIALKSLRVMESEKYRELFPEVELTKSAIGSFANSKGGDRLACTVGGKNPMGFHAHFLCLPPEARVLTDVGEIPIKEVVENRLPVRVLSYNHSSNRREWRAVDAYHKTPGRLICSVHFTDDSVLEATDDHPVYVEGVGYVAAGVLRPGDEVKCALPVQTVRRKNLPPAAGRRADQKWVDVLFASLPGVVHERPEPPSLRQRQASVRRRGLLGSLGRRAFERVYAALLQPGLSDLGVERSKPPAVGAGGGGVRPVRGCHVGKRQPSKRTWGRLLFKSLCGPGAFGKDAGGGQSQLHRWDGRPGLYRRFQENEAGDSHAGGGLLFPLRSVTEEVRKVFGRSSRRLGQGEQPQGQSCSAVPQMPHGTSGGVGQTPSAGTKTVAFVERAVRLPAALYNLGIAGNRNYFADGVLVHNCGDDLIDPQKVLSPVELATAKEFVENDLPTRVVDKDVSVMIMIMQRLGRGDPTDVMLDVAKREGARPVRRVCLPCDDGWPDVCPEEHRAKYRDYNVDAGCLPEGLMDPVRLSRKALDAFKARSLSKYAGQFGQSPKPMGGQRFASGSFYKRTPVRAAPYDAKRIRYVDRAATLNGGCATAATLMAMDERGDAYVEHCLWGQWEPDERNDRLVAQAHADRVRYGPNNEPWFYVEGERGSTGEESFRNLARRLRRELPGIRVLEDLPTGSKDVRSEPWADAVAQGTVVLVDDGRWDVTGYVEEHEHFQPVPGKRVGGLVDRVDSSSGAYNMLCKRQPPGGHPPALRNFFLGGPRKLLRLAVLSADRLAAEVVDHRCLIVRFADPPAQNAARPAAESDTNGRGAGDGRAEGVHVVVPDRGGVPAVAPAGETVPAPPLAHGCRELLEALTLEAPDVAPAELQDKWEEPLAPYGRPPAELVLRPETHGKRLWAVLLARREPAAEVLLLVDGGGGDRRALSAALAIADALRLPRPTCLYVDAQPDADVTQLTPGNGHFYAVIKAAKGLVIA
jgi:hypothetical protein